MTKPSISLQDLRRRIYAFGWKRWSRRWLYKALGLHTDYRVRGDEPQQKALPV